MGKIQADSLPDYNTHGPLFQLPVDQLFPPEILSTCLSLFSLLFIFLSFKGLPKLPFKLFKHSKTSPAFISKLFQILPTNQCQRSRNHTDLVKAMITLPWNQLCLLIIFALVWPKYTIETKYGGNSTISEHSSSSWRARTAEFILGETCGRVSLHYAGPQGQNEPQSRNWTMVYKGRSVVTYFYQLGSASLMLCSLPKKKHQL